MPETIEGYPQRPEKRNPRRGTKDYEGPLRGWRKLKRDPPKVGKEEKISTTGANVSVKGAKDETAKGFQGVGKDSKGVGEGPPRTLRFSTDAHSIIEPVSFLCSSFSSCLSCLSMFNDAANRINGTWSLLPIGHEHPLFHSRIDWRRRAGAGLVCGSRPGIFVSRYLNLPKFRIVIRNFERWVLAGDCQWKANLLGCLCNSLKINLSQKIWAKPSVWQYSCTFSRWDLVFLDGFQVGHTTSLCRLAGV